MIEGGCISNAKLLYFKIKCSYNFTTGDTIVVNINNKEMYKVTSKSGLASALVPLSVRLWGAV